MLLIWSHPYAEVRIVPFPLLLLKEDALGDALLDECAVGVVGGIGPVDLYHEPLRTIADKLIANLLGALAPKLVICDGSSVAELHSSHCHKPPLLSLPIVVARQKKEGAIPCRVSSEALELPCEKPRKKMRP